jgi:hypothetical protein
LPWYYRHVWDNTDVNSRMEPLEAVHMKLIQSKIQTSRGELERVPDDGGLRMEDSIVEVLPSNDQ